MARKAPAKANKPVIPTFNAPDPATMKGEDGLGYPSVTWMSSFGGDPDANRFWTLNRENASQMPSPFWEEATHRFGGNPSVAPTEIYKTERLRCVPIAIRKRQVVEVGERPNKQKFYYPIKTRKTSRRQGKFSFHYQVLVNLAGLPSDELHVLGLPGFTKTVSWDHDGKRYKSRGFSLGVHQSLNLYIEEMSEKWGSELPMWCFWYTDLVGYQDEKPIYLEVGSEADSSYVQPFVLDMSIDETLTEGHRYIGQDKQTEMTEIYHDIAVPWMAEWADGGAGLETTEEPVYNGETPIGDEEDDEIPF